MSMEWLRRAFMNPWPALLSAGLTAGQSVRTRGVRRTALFVALGLGLPALAEAYAVTLRRDLRHHMQLQLKGVPLNAILGWYTIMYAVFSLLESIGTRHGLERGTQRWALPPGTAAVATSLDLILDCVGLDLGLWEWSRGGPYAPEVVGPNGQHGIPMANFVGWLALTGTVGMNRIAVRRWAALAARSHHELPAPLLLDVSLVRGVWYPATEDEGKSERSKRCYGRGDRRGTRGAHGGH